MAAIFVKWTDTQERNNPAHAFRNTTEDQWIGCDGYAEMIQNANERITSIDNSLIRLDSGRVTMLDFRVSSPDSTLTQEQLSIFFKNAYSVFEENVGSENVAGAVIYNDMDKPIMHLFVIPYDHQRGTVSTLDYDKDFVIDITNEIEQMCVDNFGVGFQRRFDIESVLNELENMKNNGASRYEMEEIVPFDILQDKAIQDMLNGEDRDIEITTEDIGEDIEQGDDE